jgi:hypothetical protein
MNVAAGDRNRRSGISGNARGTISPQCFRPPRMPVKSILREIRRALSRATLHKLPGEKYAHLE